MKTVTQISALKDKRDARKNATFAAVMAAYDELTIKLGRQNVAEIIASGGRRGFVLTQHQEQKLAA